MAGKNKEGAPTKKTPEVVGKLEAAAALDCTIAEMAFHAHIHRDTLYEWLKTDKKLSDRLETLRSKPGLQARLTTCKAMAEGDVLTSKWYLERKYKKEFSTLQRVKSDFTGKIETTDPDMENLKNDVSGLANAVDREVAEIEKLKKALKEKPRKK